MQHSRAAITGATHGPAHGHACASVCVHGLAVLVRGRTAGRASPCASPGLRDLAIFRLLNAVSSSYLRGGLLWGSFEGH